ncbi:MAG: phage major capsid protein [Burkholderiales bacterium]|nr:phage major capsid protein [Burkholderiales bacterium]
MSEIFELKELSERRFAVAKEMANLVEACAKDNKTLNQEDRNTFDAYDTEINELDNKIETKKREIRASQVTESKPAESLYTDKPVVSNRGHNFTKEEKGKALAGWLFHGTESAKREYSAAAVKCGMNLEAKQLCLDFGNARLGQTFGTDHQEVGTASFGGDLVEVELMNAIQKGMTAYGKIRNVCRVLPTSKGHQLDIPVIDDNGNVGEELAEGGQVAVLTAEFDKVSLNAYKVGSNVITSRELLEDSILDLPQFLGDLLSERLSRKQEAYYATGDGSGRPHGILNAANVGKQTAHYLKISFNELIDWHHSVNPAYRDKPGAAYMIHDSVLKLMRQMVDGDDRPILIPTLSTGLAEAPRDSFMSKPVYTNNSFNAVASNAVVGAFGDWSSFWVRDVNQMYFQRNDYLYAETDEIGFFVFLRTDSELVCASSVDPITTLKMASGT